MMLLKTPPDSESDELTDYYRQRAGEGVVFRGTMSHETFGLSNDFDPEWSVAALCWCAGGIEKYEFPNRPGIRLKTGAVLAIGEQERYAFAARGERPFISSMIVFPMSMTRSLRCDPLADANNRGANTPAIRTRLFKPGKVLMSRMESVAAACASGADDDGWFEEQVSLIAVDLFADQQHDRRRPDRVVAAKEVTRKELVRRLGRAVELIHDAFDDPTLDLEALARIACIARHHFARVFAAAYGITPLRYLADVRMDVAARLLESLDASVAEVATLVGYTNRSAFQRRFQRDFGVTPADWRRRSRT